MLRTTPSTVTRRSAAPAWALAGRSQVVAGDWHSAELRATHRAEMAHSARQIRDAFREFFRGEGHEVVPSASLVPQNDPTLMFVNAGMVPFKNVFTGQEKRPYTRATSAQKCIRISGKHNDLENVGVTARHHTFFEMLGNFSFGDYFKRDAIDFGWRFLTETMGLDSSRLLVSVFGGEGDLPPDTEAEQLWQDVAGVPKDRIVRCGASENFWQMGDTGPCGPCSEVHYYFGAGAPDVGSFGEEPGEDGRGWVELWNLVFMQFDRDAEGELHPLPAPSIDTGMGLERIACVLQGVVSNYDTDLLRPVVDLTAQIAGKRYGGTLSPDDVSMRVIADHARTSAFLIAEGVLPDRDEREYVLRRVMRRAIRHAHRLGIERLFLHECALLVADQMADEYPELAAGRALIGDICQQEEERFRATLKRGLDRLSGYVFPKGEARLLPGTVAFELYDTYGFPIDLQDTIGREQGFTVDHSGFDAALEAARQRSAGSKLADQAVDAVYRKAAERVGQVAFVGYDHEQATSEIVALAAGADLVECLEAGAEGAVITRATPFYGESGGQVGDMGEIRGPGGRFRVTDTHKPLDGLVVHLGRVEQGSLGQGDAVELHVDRAARAATRRNHSATHLLHLALRQVVGPQAMQKGSLVGPDRLRFDYTAAKPLSQEQIEAIERIVVERVLRNEAVTTDVLPMDEAKQRGAIGIFEEKYGDVVRMLTIADSIELCGGTHVARTGDIGGFKILSEGGVAAGVRRIEAATGTRALAHAQKTEQVLAATAALVKGTPLQVVDKVERMVARQKELQREVERLKRQLVTGGSGDLTAQARKVGDTQVLGATVDVGDPKALRDLADQLRDKLSPAVVALGTTGKDGKAILICTVSKDLTKRFKAGQLVKEMASVLGGSGGGRPDFAQAGASDATRLAEAVQRVYDLVAG